MTGRRWGETHANPLAEGALTWGLRSPPIIIGQAEQAQTLTTHLTPGGPTDATG